MLMKFFLFLILNFAALAIGGLFTGSGVSSDWYNNLNKAPWTPPGWVFGFAWTLIMILFTFYMANATTLTKNTKALVFIFAIQWILNVIWNPVFFYFNNAFLGLVVISALTILIAFIFIRYWPDLKMKSFFILPYFLWLIIATSLNAYIFLKN